MEVIAIIVRHNTEGRGLVQYVAEQYIVMETTIRQEQQNMKHQQHHNTKNGQHAQFVVLKGHQQMKVTHLAVGQAKLITTLRNTNKQESVRAAVRQKQSTVTIQKFSD